MKFAFAAFALACASMSASAWADSEQLVATVTNDITPTERYQFHVVVDDSGDLKALSYSQAGQQSAKVFSIEQIRQGAVLIHDDSHGFDVVTLDGEKLNAKDGGAVKMVYLSNGITHGYRYMEMHIAREGAQWALHTPRSRGFDIFTLIHIQARRFLGKVIGIGYIDVK